MDTFSVSRDLVQITLYLGLLCLTAVPLGRFMAQVYEKRPHIMSSPLGWLERLIYRLSGIDPSLEMSWKDYAKALLCFNAAGFIAVLALQVLQGSLPLNPQHLPNLPFALALNTAVSFVTNTNWQAYSGEAAMSYATQMLGLAVQNFLSAATGMAVAVALTRAFQRKLSGTIGNFWSDMVRSTVYILLPLSLLFAVFLIGQGVVQSFQPYVQATSVEGVQHLIPLGPAASQIAIKQLGTNGGGFFGVNSAHPFENSTPLCNFFEMFAILMIPAAMVYMFGRMVRQTRQGWSLFAAMMLLFVSGLTLALVAEYGSNAFLGGLPFLEGKELRFGIGNSVLWGVATTAASNGSVNAMHDSFSPLGGLVTLINILLGEVIWGGVGAGLYGILMFVVLTVFIAGLMVGRTPEYLGKKVEAREIILASVAVLVPCAIALLFTALGVRTEAGLSSLANKGPHGLSEILYAFGSMANNNGSAFAGLNANTPFYNELGAISMIVGRFVVILPALAIAGSLAAKKTVPPSPGTFPTDGTLFVLLLVGVIVIVGALTYLPALALGPIAEHLLLGSGKGF